MGGDQVQVHGEDEQNDLPAHLVPPLLAARALPSAMAEVRRHGSLLAASIHPGTETNHPFEDFCLEQLRLTAVFD